MPLVTNRLVATTHPTVSPEEWQSVRDELLAEGSENTRRGDELSRKRRELPWLPVERTAA